MKKFVLSELTTLRRGSETRISALCLKKPAKLVFLPTKKKIYLQHSSIYLNLMGLNANLLCHLVFFLFEPRNLGRAVAMATDGQQ